MGSNMAEAHPVGFQWVVEAKARGAKVIHIDPRFTRTSALADTYVPLRAGSDIAFLGGVINYILSNDQDFREYVAAYTNALVHRQRGVPATPRTSTACSPATTRDTAAYDTGTWQYEGIGAATTTAGPRRPSTRRRPRPGLQHESGGPQLEGRPTSPPQDPTLQHPRCVYQILKRHFARYTPEMVEEVCGVPREQFLQVCEDWTANSGRERTTAVVYAVGWTQHSVGVQYIRTGRDHPAAAGQHGPPGRRDHGDARARQHPGLHRHPDAVQPAARLPADAERGARTRACQSTWTPSCGDKQKGFWRNADAYFVSPAEGVLGRRRDRRRTTTASTTCPG